MPSFLSFTKSQVKSSHQEHIGWLVVSLFFCPVFALSADNDDLQLTYDTAFTHKRAAAIKGRGILRRFWKDPHIWIYSEAFARRFYMPERWQTNELLGVSGIAYRRQVDDFLVCEDASDQASCHTTGSCYLTVFEDPAKTTDWWPTDSLAGLDIRTWGRTTVFIDLPRGSNREDGKSTLDPGEIVWQNYALDTGEVLASGPAFVQQYNRLPGYGDGLTLMVPCGQFKDTETGSRITLTGHDGQRRFQVEFPERFRRYLFNYARGEDHPDRQIVEWDYARKTDPEGAIASLKPLDPYVWMYTSEFAQEFDLPPEAIDDGLKGAAAMAIRWEYVDRKTCKGFGPTSCRRVQNCYVDLYLPIDTPFNWQLDSPAMGFAQFYPQAWHWLILGNELSAKLRKKGRRWGAHGSIEDVFYGIWAQDYDPEFNYGPLFSNFSAVEFDRETIPGYVYLRRSASCEVIGSEQGASKMVFFESGYSHRIWQGERQDSEVSSREAREVYEVDVPATFPQRVQEADLEYGEGRRLADFVFREEPKKKYQRPTLLDSLKSLFGLD